MDKEEQLNKKELELQKRLENISNMEKYVLTKILNNISQLQLQKLKYIYNDQKLEDIIYEKIQLAVISYATEINTTPNQNEAS